MKKIEERLKKRCPQCHVDNEEAAVQCKKCRYEFEEKTKSNPRTDENGEEPGDWPSDEWKDWNLK